MTITIQSARQATLVAARLPMIALGALGCMAVFGCGVLIKDWRLGARCGLALDDQSALFAARPSSDVGRPVRGVPGDAGFLPAYGPGSGPGRGVGRARCSWSRGLPGCARGWRFCASSTDLSASRSSWAGWGSRGSRAGLPWIRKLAMTVVTMVTISTAVTVLVAMNPYLTAHPRLTAHQSRLLTSKGRALIAQNPWQRFEAQVKLRRETSDYQRTKFANDALFRISERVKVLFVQGLGRFGPLGAGRVRLDGSVRGPPGLGPDPLGAAARVRSRAVDPIGPRATRTRGRPPTGARSCDLGGRAWIVLAVYLPMAWDRYLLPHSERPCPAGGAGGRGDLGSVAQRPPIVAAEGVDRCTHVCAGLHLWVFAILLGSYAFFWHSRDWNTASRLMLTYAIVDRGTVVITGLEQHTEDKARFQGQYYSDKPPGYSLLATVPYADRQSGYFDSRLIRSTVPRFRTGRRTTGSRWRHRACSRPRPAALLVFWAGAWAVPPGRAALVGLAYGLATPAYVYATLAYGHQATALCLVRLIFPDLEARRPARAFLVFLAGFLAAYAAVIELQAGPVSAILGFYLLAQCLRRRSAARRPGGLSAWVP